MYIECLGHLFVANRITGADKKCAILLSMIGDGTYKVLSMPIISWKRFGLQGNHPGYGVSS